MGNRESRAFRSAFYISVAVLLLLLTASNDKQLIINTLVALFQILRG